MSSFFVATRTAGSNASVAWLPIYETFHIQSTTLASTTSLVVGIARFIATFSGLEWTSTTWIIQFPVLFRIELSFSITSFRFLEFQVSLPTWKLTCSNIPTSTTSIIEFETLTCSWTGLIPELEESWLSKWYTFESTLIFSSTTIPF